MPDRARGRDRPSPSTRLLRSAALVPGCLLQDCRARYHYVCARAQDTVPHDSPTRSGVRFSQLTAALTGDAARAGVIHDAHTGPPNHPGTPAEGPGTLPAGPIDHDPHSLRHEVALQFVVLLSVGT